MRTKNKTSDQKPSFIEQARRAQIIACAIETIADVGYAQASLARIGERAKISKGVITYHFASKEELMQAVVDDVLGQFAAFVAERVPATQPWDVLKAFLRANAAFLKIHRQQLLTLFEIRHNAADLTLQGYNPNEDVARIAHILINGQQEGVFRALDAQVVATFILALRDSLIAQSAKRADLDIDYYVQEMIVFIDSAVRKFPER